MHNSGDPEHLGIKYQNTDWMMKLNADATFVSVCMKIFSRRRAREASYLLNYEVESCLCGALPGMRQHTVSGLTDLQQPATRLKEVLRKYKR